MTLAYSHPTGFLSTLKGFWGSKCWCSLGHYSTPRIQLWHCLCPTLIQAETRSHIIDLFKPKQDKTSPVSAADGCLSLLPWICLASALFAIVSHHISWPISPCLKQKYRFRNRRQFWNLDQANLYCSCRFSLIVCAFCAGDIKTHTFVTYNIEGRDGIAMQWELM